MRLADTGVGPIRELTDYLRMARRHRPERTLGAGTRACALARDDTHGHEARQIACRSPFRKGVEMDWRRALQTWWLEG